jgi:hypothetical protein
VELRPTGGLEIVIRYITRAQDRIEMRSRINLRLLAILHAPSENGHTLPQTISSEIESAQTL